MPHAQVDGVRIAYDDWGPRSDEALVCLPGWCVNRGFFEPLAKVLSGKRRVIAVDWRGHGDSESPSGDFGFAELLADVTAVVEAAGVKTVVPLAQAHGGWVAVELARQLGPRVPKLVVTSWTILDPPPPFLGVARALQQAESWEKARDQLLGMWTAGAPETVTARVKKEMGAYGFEMWARAGREILAAFGQHGTGLKALSTLEPRPRVLHLYSQPKMPEFLAAQEAFARDNSWFSVQRLEAVSHFPPLEAPETTAAALESFLA